MPQRFECSLLATDDLQTVKRVVALLNDVLPGAEYTTEWFNWKHRDNPQGRSIVATALESDTGRLVSVRVFLRMDLRDGGRSVIAFQPCDTATRHEFQRRGLFTQLTALALEEARSQGAELVYNFPNKQSQPGNLKLGWVDVGGLSFLIRPFNWWRVGSKTVGSRGGTSNFQELSEQHLAEATDWQSLAEAGAPSAGLLRGRRDAAFLKWRFEDHPLHRYQVVRHGAGAVVGRLGQRAGLREFRTVGWLGEAASEAASARACISQVKAALKPDFMSTLMHRQHPLRSTLRRSRFLQLRSPHFVVKPLSEGEALTTKKWGVEGIEKDTW